MLTVKPPQLNFNPDGVPCSSQFNDPYFSLHNGVAESRHVFIHGNRLTQRWQQLQQDEAFVIAELGFGFGINFITTCEQWINSAHEKCHLHYISIEKHPVTATDLQACLQQLRLPQHLIAHLIQYYPIAVTGSHRVHFDAFNITLTLIYGDAQDCLPDCDFLAHSWYLDGFAPSKNPQLWSENIAKQVFRLTRTQGTFSTYSAASNVKHNFSRAGFTTAKQAGYGHKRDMLSGKKTQSIPCRPLPLKHKNWLNNNSRQHPNKKAIIVGAGMAGCMVSAALAKRQWNVTLLDRHTDIANETSGNPNAILTPRLSVDHDLQSQLTLQGFIYSIQYFNQLAIRTPFTWQQCGAIQLPRDNIQWERMLRIISTNNLPADLIDPVDQLQASKLAQCDVAHAGWHIPQAGWLQPSALCSAVLTSYAKQICFTGNTFITNIERRDNQWHAHSESGNTYSADIIILANAMALNQFAQTQWCSLRPKRGQISSFPLQDCSIQPEKIICADAYITPANNAGILTTGASFITNDRNIDIRQREHNDNLQRLKRLIPDFELHDTSRVTGRAGIRAVSEDRLPLVGSVADAATFADDFSLAALGATNQRYPQAQCHQGLYIASGFGSRGLAWIPLCAETLACIISNEPSPVNQRVTQAIHPNRLLMKQLIRQNKVTQ